MNITDGLTFFQFVNLVLNFGIVPVLGFMWKLVQNQNEIKLSIMQIRIDLYKDFVTKTELETNPNRRF